MGIFTGLKSIFVGEDEIEQEEFAQYRQPKEVPQKKAPEYEKPRFEAVKEPQETISEPERPQRPQRQERPQPENNQRQQSRPQNDSRASYVKNNRNNQRERDFEMSTTTQSSFDLVLARPNNFRDVNLIGDDLNAGKTVILNLEKVKQEEATRIIDFLSGVAYANQAEFKMLANKTYAIVPISVNFSGVNLINELENNGYNF